MIFSFLLQQVNLSESILCGDLLIRGLTDDYPELVTFFDAEIVGPKHSFVTGKWEASEQTDRDHWVRLRAFR